MTGVGIVMVHVEQMGQVWKFRMARSIAGRPLYFTSAYWVDGLLVDTGCAHTADDFLDVMKDFPVKLIVNTHSHEDHIGANAVLSSYYHCPIMVHESGIRALASTHNARLKPYQHVMWGRPRQSRALPVPEVVETDHHQFRILYTPGHCSDHICLLEANLGWLFCGDAFLGGRDRALRRDYNIWQIISSLKFLVGFGPRVLFPGSGTVKEGAEQELYSKIAYLEDMGHRALEYARLGWSRRRIARKLFGREMTINYITLGHFSGKNLVRSFLDDYDFSES